ncbi:mucin-binding lectin 1 [Infundibulicybe gibba]|nr:mucin-binding lectin 1 [Infundibulicybe gibba]
MAPFLNGEGVLVTARGPGKVHLLSYQSNGKITAHIGATTTNNTGITRFLISHSYTFERFAFYWEGEGEAVFGYGQSLVRTPLGKSWKEAAMISWGQNLTTGDASANVAGAVNRDGAVTCFILPEYAI